MQSGNEIWPVCAILQNDFSIKKFYKKCDLETSSRPFLIFKEPSVKRFCGGQHADLDKFW